jgi:hypothetical protein
LIEKKIKDTGYDGFGSSYDFAAGDRETYEYDKNGRLRVKKLFGKNLFVVETYEYKT